MMSAMYTFFQENGYILEMVLAIELFTWWIDRKRHFWLRLLCCSLAGLAFSLLWNSFDLPSGSAWIQTVKATMCFLLTIPIVFLCHNMTLTQAALYATAASVAQHLSFQIARICSSFIFIGVPAEAMPVARGAAYVVIEILCLFGCHMTFARILRRLNPREMKSWLVLILLICMQLSTNFFSTVFISINPNPENQTYSAFATYDIISCLLLLILICELCQSSQREQDNAVLQRLLYQQKEQLETSKATIDLISIKCHDIKNQIATLGNHIPQEGIDELNRAIMIYDTNLNTGNEALDIILAEKSLLCEPKKIRLNCMIDGAALSFMAQADIYSLFINALDNAIEAVEQLTEAGMRSIQIRVHRAKGMAVIHIDNPCGSTPEFRDGLPQTTKADKDYHGFGVMSIRSITEKYGGYYSIGAKDGVFSLNIMLPILDKPNA